MHKKALLYLLLTTLAFTFILPGASSASDKDWTLQITDFSGNSRTLSYSDILELPHTTVSAQLSCYGQPLANGDWQGVKLSDLLDIIGIDAEATSIDLKAQDGYEVSIPMATAMEPITIIAYALDNGALNEVLRLVLPNANGNLWIGQITSISMSNSNPGEGVSTNPNDALAKIEQSYTTPTSTSSTLQPQQPTPTTNPPTTQPDLTVANKTSTQPTLTSTVEKSLLPNDVGMVASLGVVALIVVGIFVFRFKKQSTTGK